jgi:hypothetical protein
VEKTLIAGDAVYARSTHAWLAKNGSLILLACAVVQQALEKVGIGA